MECQLNCQPHPRHITPLWLWHAQLNIVLVWNRPSHKKSIILMEQVIVNPGLRCKTHGVIRTSGLTSGAAIGAWWPVSGSGGAWRHGDQAPLTGARAGVTDICRSIGYSGVNSLTSCSLSTLNTQLEEYHKDLKFTVYRLDSLRMILYLSKQIYFWLKFCLPFLYILNLMSIRSICIWKSNEA